MSEEVGIVRLGDLIIDFINKKIVYRGKELLAGGGATRLSELIIDTDKDWRGYKIKNLGAPVDLNDAARLAELPVLRRVGLLWLSGETSSAGDHSRNIYCKGDYLYWCLRGTQKLYVIDVSKRATPRPLSSVSLGYKPLGIDGKDNYLFVGGDDGLHIYDISDPKSPSEVGSLTGIDQIHGFYFDKDGDIIYACQHTTDTFRIIDVSDPTSPSTLGSITDSTNLDGAHDAYVDTANKIAFVTNYRPDSSGPALAVIDVSDPASPSILYTYYSGRNRSYITKYKDYLLLGAHGPDTGLIIADASDISSITTVMEVLGGFNSVGYWIAIYKNYAFMTLFTTSGAVQHAIAVMDLDALTLEQILLRPFVEDPGRHLFIHDQYLYASARLYDGTNYTPLLDVYKIMR